MKQEFVTSNGIVAIENKILHVKRKLQHTHSKLRLIIYRAMILATIFALYVSEESSPKRSVGILFFGLLLFISIGELGYTFATKSFSNRIPLNKIESFKTEDDVNDLEIHLHLKLSSGRTRTISFRKLEYQVEPLTALLSSYHIAAQPV